MSLHIHRVFQLFVRSHIYESEEANDEDNEKENKLNKQGSTRNTHSFLQMLSKHLHQRLVPTSRNITNSIEINLQLSQFQLQICQFLRFFVCEYEATGLAVFLGLVLSDNDLASVAGIQHARLSSNKIPMTILSVSSHSSTPDPCLFRFCIQLWLDGARILDEAEHFEYIHNSNISGSDSIHTSTYMGMPSDMTKKQMLYSTISDILYELTQLLALVAERVSMADWTLITGEYKLLIHTQLRVWSSGKKHASLVRCSRYCSAIDLGGVDLADYDDD